jgi:hypothetical protein
MPAGENSPAVAVFDQRGLNVPLKCQANFATLAIGDLFCVSILSALGW